MFRVLFALIVAFIAIVAAENDLIETAKYNLQDQRVVDSANYNTTGKLS
jgi:hypothetical protein